MIPIHYVEQRSAEMSYCVLRAPAPRGRVQVLCEQQLQVGGRTLTLAIIGSSHFLELSGDSGAMCELLACQPVDLSGLSAILERHGSDEWRHDLSLNGVAYRFRLWRESLTSDGFQRETSRLLAGGGDRLVCPFPGDAVTCLEWHVDRSHAVVETYHTFPNELAIVHSRSLIDVAEARVFQ